MTIEFDSFTTEPNDAPRPKRRAVAVLGASMLVAAAGGVGFGLGRSAGTDDAEIAPADESPATAPPATAPASEDVADTVASEQSVDAMFDEPMTTEAVESINASGGDGWTMFGSEAMSLLNERVTDSGITVRAHLGQLWEHEGGYYYDDFGGEIDWQPPGWCFESGQVRIALGGGAATGTNVIDVGSVGWWSEPYNGRAVSALTMGAPDGNPHRVVFVQAGADVTTVSASFADGSTDSTAPTNGVALLVVPGAPNATVHQDGDYTWTEYTMDYEVTFETASAETTTIDGNRSGWDDPEFQASCSPPPPALPAPGEQPAGAAEQEQTIVELMALIYSDDESEENADRIDDPTGISEARDQVRSGGFEEAAANAEAIVEELVFTTPTEAWFRYRIETTSGIFDKRFGIAVNVDGVWKITRNTICQDLSLAGGDCGGEVEAIQPPGG